MASAIMDWFLWFRFVGIRLIYSVIAMAMLRNPKWEVYAQQRAKGFNKSQSARYAGYSEKSAAVQANHIEKNESVKQRIKELHDRVSERVVIEASLTKEWVLTELQDLYMMAKNKQLITPANRSLELIGKELGMFQDVVPREIFNLMMAAMGVAVTRYVTDPGVLERIIADWEQISIAEPRQLKSGMVPGAQSSKASDPSDHNQ